MRHWGKAAGDEPQTRLSRAHEHVAQFLALAETPDRAEPSAQLPYALYDEGPPLEDRDLVTMSVPVARQDD